MDVTNMKYLPPDLLDCYNYDLKQCCDIIELSDNYINVSSVLQAHYIIAHYFTDSSASIETESMLVGVRSYDLLASAICRQAISYGGHNKYTEKIDICATLFYGLTKDHAFHDGNKRTALLILLYQLSSYGYYPKQELKKFEDLVLSVAEGSIKHKYHQIYKKYINLNSISDIEVRTISHILRTLIEKKNRGFHLNLTMKDFCTALSEKGVQYSVDNSKVKFLRVDKLWIFTMKKYTYTINFYGWTRAVEAKMARDTLGALNMIDEYASINNIVDGKPSFYKLISQFEVPLRRLKDE